MRINRSVCAILFLIFSFSLTGQSLLNQKLNLELKQVGVSDALTALSETLDLSIAFNTRAVNDSTLRDYSFENTPLRIALSEILRGSNLEFKLSNNQIILYPSKTIQISGFIVAESSGESLVNATLLDEVQKQGVITNEYGFFCIEVLRDNFRLKASYVGFKISELGPENIKIGQSVKIRLQEDYLLLGVDVVAQSQALLNRDVYQSIDIQKSLVDLSPNLGGVDDFLRAAQLLPGVNGGIDGFGGMQVRGGEAGQNMMMLDGVTVFLPYHLLGAFSIYNPNTVNAAKLMQGGFPARYGGRVSSFFDVRTREGNRYKWQSQVSANLVNANVVTEGPFAHGKGALLFSARYSPSGALFNSFFENTIFQTEDIRLTSNFYDFNLKLNYQLAENDRLYLSLFHGADRLINTSSDSSDEDLSEREINFNWSNSIGSLRWNHTFNANLFVNTTLTFSDYGFDLGNFELIEPFDGSPEEFFLYTNTARNREVGLSTDLDFFKSNDLSFRLGAGLSRSLFNLELSFIDDSDVEASELDTVDAEALGALSSPVASVAYQAHVYGEAQYNWAKNWEANLGLRLSFFNAEDRRYFNPEPRVSLAYHPNQQSRWNLSGTRMVQYIHLITSSALRLPSDLWLPSSENIRPQDAWQTELGYEYKFNPSLSLLSSVYYRKIWNVHTYVDSISYLEEIEDDTTQSYLTRGTATGYGWESSLQYKGSSNGFLLSYTLAWANRQFEEHNFGNPYPFEFDQRHQIKFFAYQKWGAFDFSLNWVYFSSAPRISFIAMEGGDVNRVDLNPPGQRNELRAEAYHRLDISLGYKFQFKATGHSLKAGAYNLYNRNNVALYEVDDEDGIFQTFPIGSLGILPSLSYSVKF